MRQHPDTPLPSRFLLRNLKTFSVAVLSELRASFSFHFRIFEFASNYRSISPFSHSLDHSTLSTLSTNLKTVVSGDSDIRDTIEFRPIEITYCTLVHIAVCDKTINGGSRVRSKVLLYSRNFYFYFPVVSITKSERTIYLLFLVVIIRKISFKRPRDFSYLFF